MRRWTGHADPLSASELGRRTGARLTVFGSLVPAGGDSVRVRATLLDIDTDRPLAELELVDHAGRVDRLGDSLAVRILGELGRNRRLELTRVASLGSTSPAALKAFLQGEQWFRRAAWAGRASLSVRGRRLAACRPAAPAAGGRGTSGLLRLTAEPGR
jgi:hypothetical protein